MTTHTNRPDRYTRPGDTAAGHEPAQLLDDRLAEVVARLEDTQVQLATLCTELAQGLTTIPTRPHRHVWTPRDVALLVATVAGALLLLGWIFGWGQP